MSLDLERALASIAGSGADPGVDAVWSAANASARRRRRTRAGAVVALVVAVAVAVAVVSTRGGVADRSVRIAGPPSTARVAPPSTTVSPTTTGPSVLPDTRFTPAEAGLLFGAGVPGDLYVVGEDGAAHPITVSGGGWAGAWSHDHTQIAFLHSGGLAVMAADGSGVRDLHQRSGFAPSWSPDAAAIAIASSPAGGSNGGALVRVNVAGGDATTIADVFAGTVSWSSTGIIAFTSLDEPLHVLTLDPDTGEQRPIDVGVSGETSWPAWAPDGTTLAVQVSSPEEPAAEGIYAVPSTGPARQLTVGNDFSPTWSPDGTRVAFLRVVANGTQLFVVDVATGAVRQLTSGPLGASYPSW